MKNICTTVEDLIMDESFGDWYFKRSKKEIKKWDELIAADEGCRQLVEEAVLLLNSIVVRDKNLSNEEKLKAEQKLMSSLMNFTADTQNKKRH